MRMVMLPLLLVAGPLLSKPVQAAKSGIGGAIIVRIPDDVSSHCIDVRRDSVNLHLRRLILNKNIGWFTEDRAAGILIKTAIEGRTGGRTEKVEFPRMFLADVREYGSGRVSLPAEQMLFHGFKLTDQGNQYEHVALETSILKKQKPTAFGSALIVLEEITREFPIPSNPYSEGFKIFARYAKGVVEKSLNDANNVSDMVKQSAIALSFSPDGRCVGDFESTGTFAVIGEVKGSEQDGIIDIARPRDYCWKASLGPAFEISFSKTGDQTACSNSGLKFIPLANPHTAFFLNAVGPVSSQAQIIRVYQPAKTGRTAVSVEKTDIRVALAGDSPGFLAFSTSFIDKVIAAAKKPPSAKKVPFGKQLGADTDGIIWTLTEPEALAADVAEALDRCKFHGVKECGIGLDQIASMRQ